MVYENGMAIQPPPKDNDGMNLSSHQGQMLIWPSSHHQRTHAMKEEIALIRRQYEIRHLLFSLQGPDSPGTPGRAIVVPPHSS